MKNNTEKNCNNCKHEEKEHHDWPCKVCRNTVVPGGDQHKEMAFMWEAAPEAVDMVNNPPHYTHGNFECIDVMVDNFGKEAVEHFCLLNAFKYVWRSNYKNGIQDIKKAMWYLDKYLELEGEQHD